MSRHGKLLADDSPERGTDRRSSAVRRFAELQLPAECIIAHPVRIISEYSLTV